MTSRSTSTSKSPLAAQLKLKSRSRREDLERLAVASTPMMPRDNLLPCLNINYVALSVLRPSTRKLRRLDPAHVREVANAIAELGFCDPVLIGSNDVVLDGEARLEAAKLLGLTTVPCIQVGHLTGDEQRLLRLAVNRLGEKGSWDLTELRIEFEELALTDAPIEISGFSLDEIDQILIGDVDDGSETGPLEPPPDAVPIAKTGDLFHLGPHRIICGDSTDPQVLRRLMADDGQVRMVLTDPPYNVRIAGHVTGGAHREFAMASGEMSDAQFLEFNRSWLDAALPHLCDGGVVGSFIDWRGLPTVHAAAIQAPLEPLNLCVWGKTNGGMGSLYRSQHELFPLFKKGHTAHVNNVVLGKKGRWRSNLWTYPGASSLGSDARRGLQDHPTVKPTAMLVDALLDLTQARRVRPRSLPGFWFDACRRAPGQTGLPRRRA